MNSCSHRTALRGQQPRGFALATTLALLALLVLISLALVAVIRVETRVGDDSAQLQDAQRNALVGLNQAIAQLQRYAGPDQAVTARADILANSAWQSPTVGNANPSGINNPFRTGVWPITNSGNLGTPVWLVSGRAEQTGGPDPVSPTSARLSPTAIGSGDFEELHLNVKLVGAGTSWPYPSAEIADQSAHDVVVRKEFLRIPAEVANGVPANQNVVGSFAYWVGDEGTKASLALQPQLNEVTYSLYSVAEQRQRLVQLAATDVFRNLFVSGFPLSADMSKMTSSNQLPFYNIPLRDAYQRQVRRYYHGLTVMSRGVLSNTLPRANGGGLKRDLSASTIALGTPYAEIGDYLNHTSYMRSSENSSDLWREYRIVPPASVSPAAGRPIHSVAPVLTEFALQFGFSVAGGTLQARVRTRAELWNPYTSALVSENLRLVVSGFPEMQVTGATPNVFPLNAALGGELVINLSPPTPRWLPGRFINWSGDLNPAIDTLNDATTWVTGFNPAVSVPGPVAQLQLAFSSCRLTVRLETASGAVLARYADIPFNAVPDGAIAPYAKTSTAMRLGYHFRLREAADSADWLNNFDPRAPNLPASAFVISSAPETQSGASIISSSSTTFLFAKAATDKSFNRDVPLFELPRQPNVSLGQLQHVQVASQPPFVIGNADGNIDQLNLLFDRFFFSGLRSSDSVPEAENGQVPNLRLELFSRGSALAKLSDVKTAGENAAKTLLVKGAFNVNSTSKEAWEAVLNGGLKWTPSVGHEGRAIKI